MHVVGFWFQNDKTNNRKELVDFSSPLAEDLNHSKLSEFDRHRKNRIGCFLKMEYTSTYDTKEQTNISIILYLYVTSKQITKTPLFTRLHHDFCHFTSLFVVSAQETMLAWRNIASAPGKLYLSISPWLTAKQQLGKWRSAELYGCTMKKHDLFWKEGSHTSMYQKIINETLFQQKKCWYYYGLKLRLQFGSCTFLIIWGHSFCDAARTIEKVHTMDRSLPPKKCWTGCSNPSNTNQHLVKIINIIYSIINVIIVLMSFNHLHPVFSINDCASYQTCFFFQKLFQ